MQFILKPCPHQTPKQWKLNTSDLVFVFLIHPLVVSFLRVSFVSCKWFIKDQRCLSLDCQSLFDWLQRPCKTKGDRNPETAQVSSETWRSHEQQACTIYRGCVTAPGPVFVMGLNMMSPRKVTHRAPSLRDITFRSPRNDGNVTF